MPRKPTQKQTPKPADPMAQIQELESCAQSCREKVAKLYQSTLTKMEKQQEKLNINLNKAKAKLAVSKEKLKQAINKNKIKSTASTKNRIEKAKLTVGPIKEAVSALKMTIDELKSNIASLKSDLKKLEMKEKALLKFEKEWIKKATQKTRKKARWIKAVKTTEAPRYNTVSAIQETAEATF